MCGIIGYIGNRDAQPVLFDCLSKLEYRGYDSCGIAVQNSKLNGHKAARRVLELSRTCSFLPGKRGIGHTRWATPSHIPRDECYCFAASSLLRCEIQGLSGGFPAQFGQKRHRGIIAPVRGNGS
jgi:glutamine phosphoribosylpyrophosphate amidotransferase